MTGATESEVGAWRKSRISLPTAVFGHENCLPLRVCLFYAWGMESIIRNVNELASRGNRI
jgi:hypothetical protein